MKHILIASDLSPEALRPFETVVRLAEQWQAKITLLHVVQDLVIAPHGAPLAPPITSPDLPAEMKRAREALEEQRKALGDEIETSSVVISSDRIPAAINKYAEEHDIDLIAISTHGRTGWRHLALGSVAEAVLRHSHVPVLSFPRQSE
jgi:nucleotide-binding universal stress UspA family protein